MDEYGKITFSIRFEKNKAHTGVLHIIIPIRISIFHCYMLIYVLFIFKKTMHIYVICDIS